MGGARLERATFCLQGLKILVIGATNLGEAPREDVEGQRDWWADD
jgi:hypothetical protein